MDGQNYVVFHNAADDSYMNTTANFRGAFAATQTVDIYFESALSANLGPAGYDKITCVVTDGEEDRAVEQLAAVMAGSGPKGRVQTIVDDVNNVYACQDVTAVTTISTVAGGTSTGVITVGSTDTTLLAGQSGSVVNINHAAVTVTLPAAAAGLNFKLILGIDTTSGAEILTATNADCFYGTIQMFTTHATDDQAGSAQQLTHATAIAAPASYDAMKFVAATNTIGGVAGSVYDVYAVDSTAWHVSTPYHATSDAAPGDVALIVAR